MKHKPNGLYSSDDDPDWAERLKNGKGTPTYRERIEEQGRRKAANALKERFVRLGEIMTGSPAWKALGSGARDAYSWIERRYRKTNNGKIPMGARELAEKMGVGKDAANRYLRCLQALGFIAPARRGHFGDRTSARRTTRWRLTEYGVDGGLPTRDYLNFDFVEASLRVREVSKRDPKRLHPKRRENFVRPQKTDVTSGKDGRVRPQNADTAPISVYGIMGFASAKDGQSTAVPGEGAGGADLRRLLGDIRQLQTEQISCARQAGRQQQPRNGHAVHKETITLSMQAAFSKSERRKKSAARAIKSKIEKI
jgi:hypothetical protein